MKLWRLVIDLTIVYVVVVVVPQNGAAQNEKWFTKFKISKRGVINNLITSRWGLSSVWPDWAIYWTLGKFSKPLATINLPKSPTFLGNFCKGVKIFDFSSEIIFWATFIVIWWLFFGHTDHLDGGVRVAWRLMSFDDVKSTQRSALTRSFESKAALLTLWKWKIFSLFFWKFFHILTGTNECRKQSDQMARLFVHLFGHFSNKICPIASTFYQSRLNIFPNTTWTLKNFPKSFNILKFRQIWSHWPEVMKQKYFFPI